MQGTWAHTPRQSFKIALTLWNSVEQIEKSCDTQLALIVIAAQQFSVFEETL